MHKKGAAQHSDVRVLAVLSDHMELSNRELTRPGWIRRKRAPRHCGYPSAD